MIRKFLNMFSRDTFFQNIFIQWLFELKIMQD
jgi:hypothetical protein